MSRGRSGVDRLPGAEDGPSERPPLGVDKERALGAQREGGRGGGQIRRVAGRTRGCASGVRRRERVEMRNTLVSPEAGVGLGMGANWEGMSTAPRR